MRAVLNSLPTTHVLSPAAVASAAARLPAGHADRLAIQAALTSGNWEALRHGELKKAVQRARSAQGAAATWRATWHVVPCLPPAQL